MKKVIEQFKYSNKKFPREAVDQAVENQEETTQILLEEFDQMLEHPEVFVEDTDFMLHIYAMYMLAQFREKEAFQRIIDLVSFTPEHVDMLLGDIITEDLNSILYSTFDGDFTKLESLIENPKVDIYVRGAALDVYGKLCSDDVIEKDSFVEYLRKLLKDDAVDYKTDLANMIQSVVLNKHVFEMVDDIQHLYDEGRIDEIIVGQYDSFIDFMYDYSYDRETVYYIEDAAAEISGWPMFEQSEEDKLRYEQRLKKLEAEYKQSLKQGKTTKKIERNDQCPCGSGKKFKKCCMKKDNIYKVKHQEPLEIQNRWLENYPITKGERKEGEVRITDHFDEESIKIDRLVYLSLHHRARPIWENVNKPKEENARISYLIDAFKLFQEKCAKENIESFEEYDRLYKIHYRSKDWVEQLYRLYKENNLMTKFEDLSEQLIQTIDKLS